MDAEFFEAYDNGKYNIVSPRIRGKVEQYVAIPHDDKCVQELDVLIEEIRNR